MWKWSGESFAPEVGSGYQREIWARAVASFYYIPFIALGPGVFMRCMLTEI